MKNPRNLLLVPAIICIIFIVNSHITGAGYNDNYWIAFTTFFVCFCVYNYGNQTVKQKQEN